MKDIEAEAKAQSDRLSGGEVTYNSEEYRLDMVLNHIRDIVYDETAPDSEKIKKIRHML